MSVYDDRPWLRWYTDGVPADLEVDLETAIDMFDDAVRRRPDSDLIRYFDTHLTVREVDEAASSFGAGLQSLGLEPGDRVALYFQNVPQFLIATLGVWRIGGTVVPVNPMNKEEELRHILDDSGARALVALETLYDTVARHVVPETSVDVVITTSELDYLDGETPALLGSVEKQTFEETEDFRRLISATPPSSVVPHASEAGDVAFITYTSGTTGRPKGAMNTHRNVVFNTFVFRRWMDMTPDDVVLGIAPLFHITGLIAHMTVAFLVPMPLILGYRFDAGVMVELARRHGATFTVGAITAFMAMMNDPASEGGIPTLTKVFSGGAPVAPATAERFTARFGPYLHNIYGLTETTSPSHSVPLGGSAPVDPVSGALSVGVPVCNTIVRVVDDDGNELPAGEAGELVTEGPQVIPGYWNRPEESAEALPGGALKTGDVGFMDEDGWFYVIDRKKDMINASGYKVWPREVEDVLYSHPAIREAAVVGVADEYRGETVKAVVSLRPGTEADEAELIAYCKERLANYKYPRMVEIVDQLPVTTTGKIMRRTVRDRAAAQAAAGKGH